MKVNSPEVTADQKDAITEIFNIGFGRAASSLSVMIGSRIELSVPELDTYALPDLIKIMGNAIPHEAVIIHQVFSGSISGDAILLMDVDSASLLVDLLSGGSGIIKRISPSDREALIEVGNILMNGYIGSFSNQLHFKLNFDTPHMHEESLRSWLENMPPSHKEELQYVVLVRTEFVVAKVKAYGYVAFLISPNSFATLIETIEKGLRE